jgi:hypothetical protein
MSLIIVCPSCGSKLKVPDNFAGRRAKCSKCGNPISVPATEEPEVIARPAPRLAPAQEQMKPKPQERYEPEPQAKYGPGPQEPEEVDADADEDRPKRRKKKKRLKKRPAQGNSTWMWWTGGCLAFLIAALVGVVIAIRAGYATEVIFYGVSLAIMLPFSAAILIVSMILSSHFAGGIDFGEVHTTIPKALALLLIVDLIGMIPYVGWFLALLVWWSGLMYLFNLDFWECWFLVAINWILNWIVWAFLLALVLGAIFHMKPDRFDNELPYLQQPGNTQQAKDLDALEELGGDVDTENERINLTGSRIADAGLVHVKSFTKLQTLELGSTQITDAGLVHLRGLTALRTLDLSRTRVSDAGLVHLRGLSQLQIVDLTGTGVTAAGIRDLQKALPRTKIIVKGP